VGVSVGVGVFQHSLRESNFYSERCQSGRMGRSRKPLTPLPGSQGSNPCLSANKNAAATQHFFFSVKTKACFQAFRERKNESTQCAAFLFESPLNGIMSAANNPGSFFSNTHLWVLTHYCFFNIFAQN
jgi:hypothetical protein